MTEECITEQVKSTFSRRYEERELRDPLNAGQFNNASPEIGSEVGESKLALRPTRNNL